MMPSRLYVESSATRQTDATHQIQCISIKTLLTAVFLILKVLANHLHFLLKHIVQIRHEIPGQITLVHVTKPVRKSKVIHRREWIPVCRKAPSVWHVKDEKWKYESFIEKPSVQHKQLVEKESLYKQQEESHILQTDWFRDFKTHPPNVTPTCSKWWQLQT